MSSESRSELINWLNDLLHLNLSKVEQAGTGAPLCQVVDSIYGDVPLHKVKFNTLHEYEYVQNFKVLQEAFAKHNIDRHIPVDRLIKLKFQDNLEFLQWMKKFWDGHFPGGNYDALRRRGADPVAPLKSGPARSLVASETAAVRHQRPSHAAEAALPVRSPARKTQASLGSAQQGSGAAGHGNNGATFAVSSLSGSDGSLAKTVTELRVTIDEMEKERDFYFAKLRDIEILTQKTGDPAITRSDFFKQVTEILYTTEEGFEVPLADPSGVGGGPPQATPLPSNQ